MVIEIGRKMRAPADEEHGVETYSALWGVRGAVRVWLLAIVATGLAAFAASSRIGTDVPTLLMLVVLVATCATVGERFMRDASPGRGRWIEAMAGVWTVLLYVGLGAVPLAFAAVARPAMTPMIIDAGRACDSADVGGKARTLARAARSGLAVPAFCVVSEHACGAGSRSPAEMDPDLRRAVAAAIEQLSPDGHAFWPCAHRPATRTARSTRLPGNSRAS